MKKNNQEPNNMQYMPIGMSIGISIGMAIGVAAGNIGVGMCIGLSIGMGVGILIDSRIKKNDAGKTENAGETKSEETPKEKEED